MTGETYFSSSFFSHGGESLGTKLDKPMYIIIHVDFVGMTQTAIVAVKNFQVTILQEGVINNMYRLDTEVEVSQIDTEVEVSQIDTERRRYLLTEI